MSAQEFPGLGKLFTVVLSRGLLRLQRHFIGFCLKKKDIVQQHGNASSRSVVHLWDCETAFKQKKFTSSPILGFPDFSRPFIVETDASFRGLGAVLSQE